MKFRAFIITASSLLGIPASIIVVRHFTVAGWVQTLVLLGIWGVNLLSMLYLIGRERVRHAPNEELVHDFMTRDSDGAALTTAVVRSDDPAQQWTALSDFGRACFELGETAALHRDGIRD